MPAEPPAYEERYGWTRRTVLVVAASAAFVVVALVAPMPVLLRVAAVVLFGGGAAILVSGILSRRVALRVDADGVTLGGSPLRYRATTRLVPWADIVTVMLWRQVLPPYSQTLRYVGLKRRAEVVAALPPGRAGRSIARALAGHVSPDVVAASRAVNGWQLDDRRLAAAVGHFAPAVPVVDAETGRVVTASGD